MHRADLITTFTCRLSRNYGSLKLLDPYGPARPVQGKLNRLPLPLPSLFYQIKHVLWVMLIFQQANTKDSIFVQNVSYHDNQYLNRNVKAKVKRSLSTP